MVRKIRYEDYLQQLTSEGFQHSLLLTRSACNGSKEGIDYMVGDELARYVKLLPIPPHHTPTTHPLHTHHTPTPTTHSPHTHHTLTTHPPHPHTHHTPTTHPPHTYIHTCFTGGDEIHAVLCRRSHFVVRVETTKQHLLKTFAEECWGHVTRVLLTNLYVAQVCSHEVS